MFSRPTVFVFTVGHAGSSVVAKAIALLGWIYASDRPSDDRRCEIREVNRPLTAYNQGEATRPVAVDNVRQVLRRIPQGFVIKTPKVAGPSGCVLLEAAGREHPHNHCVFLVRDYDILLRSYQRRGQADKNGSVPVGQIPIQQRIDYIADYHDRCTGPKSLIDFDRLLARVCSEPDTIDELLGLQSYGPFSAESRRLAASIFNIRAYGSPDGRKGVTGWEYLVNQ